MDSLKQLCPCYCDVTFGAGGSTTARSLQVVETFQNYHGMETMLHLTCTNMNEESISRLLEEVKSRHLQNILALRGDPPEGQTHFVATDARFQYAVDLVRFIREKHGDYFNIAVAGYPEKHLEAASYEEDLKHLKEKIDAGADMIVTQMCFSPPVFEKFVNDCRALGIQCPIIPGILLFGNYAGVHRMATLSGVAIPEKMEERLLQIKDDNAAVSAYAVDLAVEMVQYCMARGMLGFHFYVLNLEKAVKTTLTRLGWPIINQASRTLPFLEPGQTFQAALGEARFEMPLLNALVPAYRMAAARGDPEFRKQVDRRTIWGAAVAGPADVNGVFGAYYEGKIHRLPWSEDPVPRTLASCRADLADLAKHGVWAVHAQNGLVQVPSTDPIHGWGGPDGLVSQLAGLEFFMPKAKFAPFMAAVNPAAALVHAVHISEGTFTNVTTGAEVIPTAWGQWGEEKRLATVMDAPRFNAAAIEAFALWLSKWATLYAEGSSSRQALEAIQQDVVFVSMLAPQPQTTLTSLIAILKLHY
eukprot:GAFH01001351.1.p2 GENE.GAFH01001351.1~~GAFH01001351.1.p2  ORF type:complete len:529 (-),score=246.99 GAFH01001351.1:15-1601(-)